MTKVIKKINNFFICDEDESPSATDYIAFYGFSVLGITITMFVIVGFLKGVN